MDGGMILGDSYEVKNASSEWRHPATASAFPQHVRLSPDQTVQTPLWADSNHHPTTPATSMIYRQDVLRHEYQHLKLKKI